MLKKALAFTCLTLSIGANAALIDNITYVTDDEAGIDYLKLSNTVGYSWNDVVVNDYLGYINDGWEVTSQSGLMTLDDVNNQAYDLINDYRVIYVMTDGDAVGGQYDLPVFVYFDTWYGYNSYITYYGVFTADERSSDHAVSLQRITVVPTPAAAWLFMSGIVGLAGGKRLSRSKRSI